MKIENLLKQAMDKFNTFDPEIAVKKLAVNDYLGIEHGEGDIRNKKEVGNYCFFPGFIELLRPIQIIELGSAMGVTINCMLSSSYKDFELYGITLAERGKEFCFIKKDTYPNLHMIIGDYMDLSNWPKDLDLGKTDFWYVDGLHLGKHVKEELLLYKQFFKPGTIIAFDDIFINGSMAEVWHDLENILDIGFKTTLPLHWTGWGIVQIGKKNR